MKIAVLARDLHIRNTYPAKDNIGRSNIDDANAVRDALVELGHDVEFVCGDKSLFDVLRKTKFDFVFNVRDDGFNDNLLLEPHIPAFLDMLGVPYSGNNYLALALCFNKARVKKLLHFHRILTPRFQIFSSEEEKLNKRMGFPMIVKPVHEDGSIGIRDDSVVKNEGKLRRKIAEVIAQYKQDALVEEFIDGREFNVGVIGNKEPRALAVSEIDFSKLPEGISKIVSYDAKWVKNSIEYNNTPASCPAKIDKRTEERIIETALECYKIFECRGYARVDFRYKDGKLYVLEVNPNPDISADAGLANAACASGMSYTELIKKILEYGIEANKKKRKQWA